MPDNLWTRTLAGISFLRDVFSYVKCDAHCWFGTNMNSIGQSNPKEQASPLTIAFWCSAPIPVIAIFLGYVLTPGKYYKNELWGGIFPAVAYGITGFFAAAASFCASAILLWPGRFRPATFVFRARATIFVSALACVGAVCVGLKLIAHEPPV